MSDLKTSIMTRVDPETGNPSVNLVIYDADTGNAVLPITMAPEEARQLATWLVEAAEAVDLDAHLVVVLRSHKISEEDITQILRQARLMRGGMYATVEDSPEIST